MSGLVWVELDGGALEHNLKELRKGSAPGVLSCAVVKSNAYGHGIAQVSKLLPSAEWFGVNSLDEGLELRRLGVERPILLLGPVPLADLGEAVEAALCLTVYNRETIERLSAIRSARGPARVHVKVDTGTSRQGVLPENLEEFLKLVLAAPGVRLEGLSTHYANIEDTLNHAFAQLQIGRFQQALVTAEKMAGRIPYVHTACTAAALLFQQTHFTMLRTGIGLYGLWPSRETMLSARERGGEVPSFRPVLRWKTRIAQIKTVPQGSYVGYGCSYRTTRATLLGVLPVGYADGYTRMVGNRGHVLVNGRRAPVIGRICMNLCMVDLTDLPSARLEEEVVLLGTSGDETISAETMAEWTGTINYEVVTRISPLLPRKVV
ncbi:MAG TPA: alanine racemase [Spirochaetia bacterium]|nr:alanine racemase [Spirochaetia bacterium]